MIVGVRCKGNLNLTSSVEMVSWFDEISSIVVCTIAASFSSSSSGDVKVVTRRRYAVKSSLEIAPSPSISCILKALCAWGRGGGG
jgi:hypothetical protein